MRYFSLSGLLMLSPEYCFDLAYSDELLRVLHLLSFCIHSYLNLSALSAFISHHDALFLGVIFKLNTFLHIFHFSVDGLFLFVRLLQTMTPFHFPLKIRITFFLFFISYTFKIRNFISLSLHQALLTH